MRQEDLIKRMTDNELKGQLLFSQFLFLLIGIFLSFFLFEDITDWFTIVNFDFTEILYYGTLPGVLIVGVDLFLYTILPKHLFDDGGINEKVFKNQSVFNIFIIALVVAICEEALFRGVIQTSFGYVFASTLFIIVHIRYLKKPALLISIIFVSFYIGYLYELTSNLLVTIVAHFIVDFLLGLYIKFRT